MLKELFYTSMGPVCTVWVMIKHTPLFLFKLFMNVRVGGQSGDLLLFGLSLLDLEHHSGLLGVFGELFILLVLLLLLLLRVFVEPRHGSTQLTLSPYRGQDNRIVTRHYKCKQPSGWVNITRQAVLVLCLSSETVTVKGWMVWVVRGGYDEPVVSLLQLAL